MTKLNRKLKTWLDKVNTLTARQQAAGVETTPIAVRASFATMTAMFVTRRPEMAWTGDTMVETGHYPVPVRIYDPAPDVEKPVCLFFHGGGHMAGSVTVYDPICRKIATASGALVVAPEYRLAPECPYPHGLDDCLNLARAIWPALERKQRRFRRSLYLVGDSGGGAFAATVSALAQGDPNLVIDKQVLIYPGLDYTLSMPSVETNGTGYLLEKSRIAWYFDQYFQNNENRRTVSPLYMPISDKLPETLMITAGYCPLRDEALAYVERLRSAGVTCEHHHFEDMIHAYLNLENLAPEACAQSHEAVGRFLG